MSRIFWLMLCVSLISLPVAADAAEPVCPSSIQVEQRPLKEPGWDVHKAEPTEHQLKCTQQVLVPDPKQLPLVWEPDAVACLDGKQRDLKLPEARRAGYRVHLVCVYEGTTATLTKVIPAD